MKKCNECKAQIREYDAAIERTEHMMQSSLTSKDAAQYLYAEKYALIDFRDKLTKMPCVC